MPKKLLRDTVALWLNTASLESAIMAARDMRACTRTVVITPNFFLANGPAGIRCFYELGISDIVLNMRLLGTPKEIWQCVSTAADLGVKAITVSAMAGIENIKYAVQAAEASKATTMKLERPKILVTLLPSCLNDSDMVDQLRMRVRRPGHVEQACRQVMEAGADGIVVEYEDVKYVRRVSRKIPFLVFAQRRVRNYMEVDREDEQGKAGITEILECGASHIIFDSELVRRTDVEWAADMINKELEAAVGV